MILFVKKLAILKLGLFLHLETTLKEYLSPSILRFNLNILVRVNYLIKGCNMEIVDENLNATYEFHCFISDDNRYDTSTTHTHMIYILQQL